MANQPAQPETPCPIDVLKVLSGGVRDKNGQPVTLGAPAGAPAPAALADDKILGLYFSAHWCPPCRNFTPVLANTYKNLQDQGKDFEVVFLSWDNDPNQYSQYAGSMPWARLPYKDPRVDQLAKAFGVQSIPTFITVNARTGALINANARNDVPNDRRAAKYPWPAVPPSPMERAASLGFYGVVAAAFCYFVLYPRFFPKVA
jgi:nucleoredoxin